MKARDSISGSNKINKLKKHKTRGCSVEEGKRVDFCGKKGVKAITDTRTRLPPASGLRHLHFLAAAHNASTFRFSDGSLKFLEHYFGWNRSKS